jgi:hypothetical protein
MFHLMKQLTRERSKRDLKNKSFNFIDYCHLALLLSPYRSTTTSMAGTPALLAGLSRTTLISSHVESLVREETRIVNILSSSRTDMQLRVLFFSGIHNAPQRIVVDFKETLKTIGDLDLP